MYSKKIPGIMMRTVEIKRILSGELPGGCVK